MAELPTGTVTFLFTDIVGSTRLWEEHPEAMKKALAFHDELLLAAIGDSGGYVFSASGDGFSAAFSRGHHAIAAALAAQLAIKSQDWRGAALRVRMALHTGEADERRGDYFGPAVNEAARLLAAGHGGQVLVSAATKEVERFARQHGTNGSGRAPAQGPDSRYAGIPAHPSGSDR